MLARLGLPEPWSSTVKASLLLVDDPDGQISECERKLRRLGAEAASVKVVYEAERVILA